MPLSGDLWANCFLVQADLAVVRLDVKIDVARCALFRVCDFSQGGFSLALRTDTPVADFGLRWSSARVPGLLTPL